MVHYLKKNYFEINEFNFVLGILLLALVLILPSNVHGVFDGLQWSNLLEFILILVILPFLLILDRSFLARKNVRFLLLFLLIIKVIAMISLPKNGLTIRAYSSETNLQINDHWERTYSTLLNRNSSAVLTSQYDSKLEFPVEWANGWGINEEEFYFAIRLSSSVRLPEDSHLAFIASGLKNGEATFSVSESSQIDIPIFLDSSEVSFIRNAQSSSYGTLEGELIYKQKAKYWSFIPIVVFADGHFEMAEKHDVFWQSPSFSGLHPEVLSLNYLIQNIIDIGLVSLTLIWLIISLRNLVPPLGWPIGIGISSFAILSLLMRKLLPGNNMAKTFFENSLLEFSIVEENYLAIWIVIVGIFLVLWKSRSQASGINLQVSTWKIILIAYFPLILGYFTLVLFEDINKVELLRKGNDYLTFQNFARQIFVYGDPLHKIVGTFRFQPLYRYLVGFLHFLFGHSTSSQYIFNVWAYFGTAITITWFAKSWMENSTLALLAGVSVLFLGIADRYYKFVLLTLTEHSASLFIFLTVVSWILYKKHRKKRFVFFASILGSIGTLLRLEHVLLISGLVLFSLDPLLGSPRKAWGKLKVGLYNNKKVFFTYLSFLALTLLFLAIRNWLIGGDFVLTESQSINFSIFESTSDRMDGVISVLVAKKKNFVFPSTLQSVILWLGTVLGLGSLVFRPSPIRKFDLRFGLIIFAGLAPYYFFKPIAYMPRWSIHLIPFTALAVILFGWSISEWISQIKEDRH